jgi:NitT/TauT family transport system ATP-binding protein
MVQNVQAVQNVQIVGELPGGLHGLNDLNTLNDLNKAKPMVEIQGVSKSFHKTVKEHTTEVKALADVSLSICENEFVSIIGPSGCGKTTLLKMIDGLIPYDGGKILIDGKQVTAPGPDRAVVFQAFALLPWRTVLANVEFSLELRRLPKEARTKTARDYLKRVGLSDFENHYPHELSGGMQQRASIVRALAQNPSVLLMDEPFGALDAFTRDEMNLLLLKLWGDQKQTIVFVTHNISEAIFLADRVIVMTPRPGRLAHVYDIDLPRPRTIAMTFEPSFIELIQDIKRTVEAGGRHSVEVE